MKKKALDAVMLAGLVISLLLGGMRSFAAECEKVQTQVLRLHIPANSDSSEDQQMKLQLRDYILEKYGTELAAEADINSAKERIAELLPEIEADCRAFLQERAADYSATAELTEMYFTTRSYEAVTLPAGTYTALRITLGTGEGKNWWCVMFPPLCIPVASEVTDELPDILTGEGTEIEIRFAVYELLKELLDK